MQSASGKISAIINTIRSRAGHARPLQAIKSAAAATVRMIRSLPGKAVGAARTLRGIVTPLLNRFIAWAKTIRADRATLARARRFLITDLWAGRIRPIIGVTRNRIAIGTAGTVAIVFAVVYTVWGSGDVARVDPGKYQEPAAVDDSVLRVIQSAPTGTVSGTERRREVTVVFNHPLVPLTQLEERTTGVFAVNPAVKGAFRWYGSRICAFIPGEGWEYGNTYTITVRKGTASLDGKTLADDHVFSFTFDIPALEVSVGTIPYTYGTINYDQSFTLSFNRPVNPGDLRRHLTLTNAGKTVPVTVAYWTPAAYQRGSDDESEEPDDEAPAPREEEQNRTLVVTPSVRLDRDAPVILSLGKGLRAATGDAELNKNFSKKFRTHGPLTVDFKNEKKETSFQEFWRTGIEFSNDVDWAAARTAITISPAVPWRDNSRGRTRMVNVTAWAIRPGVTYTITLAPMSDVHGNALTLSGDRTFTFTAPDYRPAFTLENDKSLLESEMRQTVPVEVMSIPSMSVGVAAFTVKDVQRELADHNYHMLDHLGYHDVTWNTGIAKNRVGRAGLDLKPYLTPRRTGWLGLRFAAEGGGGRRGDRSQTQLIQATDLGLSVKESYDSSSVWVHSIHRGTPVAGAEVTFYDAESRLGSAHTDASGYCRIPKSRPGLVEHSLYVAASGKHDRTFVTANRHGVPMYYICNQFNEHAWKRRIGGEIIFDRKLYRPGDTVQFKGVLAVREKGGLRPLRDAKVDVTLTTAKGAEVYSRTITTSPQGGLWGSYDIPTDAPLGHYQVRMAVGRDEGSYINDTFQVEEFRPVSFAVEVAGLRDASVGETIPVTVAGRYLFGAPMQSAPVNYTCTRLKRRLAFPHYSDFTFGDGQLWEDREVDWGGAGFFTSGQGALDSAGTFAFTLTPRAMLRRETIQEPRETLQLSDIYDLRLEAKVKDVDDKTVNKGTVVTVFPGAFVIGLRSKKRYQLVGNEFAFDLVALTNGGEATEGRAATVSIIRYNYRSILSRGPAGSLQPRNSLVKELVNRQEVVLSATPRTVSFTPREPGSYTVIVQERGGMSYSRDSFYAWGGGMTSWQLDDDDAVTLVPDKKEYRPGETARVLVQSPFSRCKAIVTLERESVIWQKTVEITESGTPVEIPMKEEYLPNVFLSVMLVRPRVNLPDDADPRVREEFIRNDLGIPKFKAGIVKLSVSNASRRAALEVATDRADYGPGEQVTITVKTEPHAEVALAVADRAVLDLIDYRYANPVNKLFQNWPLGVRILENRRFLIKQYRYTQKGESPGGQGKGDELEGLGGFDKDSEDGTRRDIRYTAYWNPAVVADKEGRAVVRFTLPHNLTTFRVMALASSDGRYRDANREFRVRKALVIQKNLPRFIRPGDRLSLGAVVINQTNIAGTFRFTVQSDLLKGAENAVDVEIGPGQSREAAIPAALDLERYAALQRILPMAAPAGGDRSAATGEIAVTGRLTVTPVDAGRFTRAGYKTADVTDRLEFTFPVREQLPDEAFTIAGFTTAEEKEFVRFPEPGRVLPGMGGLELTLAPTALTGLNRAFEFYKSNPVFCLEQRASAFLLTISAGDLLKEFRFRPPSKLDYNFLMIDRLFLGEAADFQNADGGFRAWKDDREGKSSPYLTAYVAFVLQEAKKRGHSVPSSLLSGAFRYLKEYVREPQRDGYTYVLETFALVNYTMALGGEHFSSLTDLLIEKEKMLSIRAQAHLAMAIALKKGVKDYRDNRHTKRIVESLKNRMAITTRAVSFKNDADLGGRCYDSDGATTAAVLRLLVAIDRANPLIPGMVNHIIADRSRRLWYDSHSAGMTALALRDFYDAYEREGSLLPSFTGTVTVGGREVYAPLLDRRKLEVQKKTYSLAECAAWGPAGINQPMVFSSSKKNRLYYTATLSYYPVMAAVTPRDEGIEVQRDIVDMSRPTARDRSGTVMRDNLKRGTVYLCRIRLVTPKPCFNAIIVDPIPSNVEIVNTAFSTEDASLAKHSSKDRPSYDYWWMGARPRIEYRDDRVVITQDYLSPGMHEFTYLVRPLIRGTAAAPAAAAKLMYRPEVFGRTGAGSLSVE